MQVASFPLVDLKIGQEVWYSLRFTLMGGTAIFRDRGKNIVKRTPASSLVKKEGRLYTLKTQEGEEWELVKLSCDCKDKSGRIW